MDRRNENLLKAPAKVFACLQSGFIRVIVWPGVGMADGGIPHDIPVELIPIDLRLPNSEFTLVLDRVTSRFVGIERKTKIPESL